MDQDSKVQMISLPKGFRAVVEIGENVIDIRQDGTVLKNGFPGLFQDSKAAFDGAGKWLRAGQEMPGGAKFVRISPTSNRRLVAAAGDAPLAMKWREAMAYAAGLDAHGLKGWRLPTKAELNEIFRHRAAIGGFDETGDLPQGRYWTSNEHKNSFYAWSQRFSDGNQVGYVKYEPFAVRCVREDDSFNPSNIYALKVL